MISAGSHTWGPPASEAQVDALRKGLGRAYQWAHAGLLSRELLLRECLQSRRHDLLFGEPKGEWLFGLVELLDACALLRERLMAALNPLDDESDFALLCDLAGRFCRCGDEAFKKILYDIVERKPIEHCPWLGEKEIVALDGESGFRFALEARIGKFGPVDWIWDGQDLMECGLSQLGEDSVTRVCECLDKGSSSFLEEPGIGIRVNEEGQSQPPGAMGNHHGPGWKRFTATELIDIAEFEGLYTLFQQWGDQASREELGAIQSLLFTASSPVAEANFLAVFAKRTLEPFDERLIERCRHGDPRIQEMAFRVLENHCHPLIGQFAREGLGRRHGDIRYMRLFIKNFEAGDENLWSGLPSGADEWLMERHCQTIVEILENHPGYHCFELGLPVYAASPCEALRFRVASLLQRLSLAPKWLLEECRFDSNPSCRALAQAPAEIERRQPTMIGITSAKNPGKLSAPEVSVRGYAV